MHNLGSINYIEHVLVGYPGKKTLKHYLVAVFEKYKTN